MFVATSAVSRLPTVYVQYAPRALRDLACASRETGAGVRGDTNTTSNAVNGIRVCTSSGSLVSLRIHKRVPAHPWLLHFLSSHLSHLPDFDFDFLHAFTSSSHRNVNAVSSTLSCQNCRKQASSPTLSYKSADTATKMISRGCMVLSHSHESPPPPPVVPKCPNCGAEWNEQ